MAKLSQFPVQCSYTCSGGTFHFPPQARKTSLATRFLPYSGGGVHFSKGREGSQKMQAKDESYERPRLCFYSRSLVGFTMKSPRVVTRKQVKGGNCGAIELFRGVGLGAVSFERLRKEVRSSSEAASQNEDGEFTQEAREVVVRVLLEAGLSQEDTAGVVSKAPVFIRELVGCFQELTESDPLASEEGTNATENVNTRDRIYQLANYSRGMSPFLESLGVHLPSVSRLSYSYSSQRLPELLSKIRYFQELLIQSEPRDRPVDGLIQFMMRNLSLSVWEDEDIQRTLSFFEKMKHKEGSWGALEQTNSALPLLIESFPQIFKRSLEDQIKPVIHFLQGLGIEGEKLGKVILCFPPILLQDPDEDLVPRKRILKKVGIRVEDMGRMVVKYPWLLSKCVEKNVEVFVKFFESIKVPKSKIDRSITRCPHLLGCSCTGALEPMVHHINGYGLKSKRLGRAISQSPELLLHSPQEFDTVVTYLESIGVDGNDISKLLRRSPEIMGSSIDSTLKKKVEVLEELGVRREKLGRIITFFPEILSMGVESALIPRIQYLRDWGFAKKEIARMVFKFPPLLGYNADTVLSPKLEFLTQTMKRSIKDVVAYPRYFSHSLEKKIKPRARVLANRQIQCDLETMLAKSDDRFAEEFLGFESMLITPIK